MATNSVPQSLVDVLTAALPADSVEQTPRHPGFSGKVRYLHTPPKPCDPLFSPPPGQDPEKTMLSSHFLSVSVPALRTAGVGSVPDWLEGQQEGVLGIGIEVLIYYTRRLTTLFVSKADTTGYLPNHPPSRTKIVCTAFLRWLVDQERRQHPSRTVVVSLFARSQSQYLFPGSAEYKAKHILDDRQLIKWWARVLDPLVDVWRAQDHTEATGYLTIPGYDKLELRKYLPRLTNGDGSPWKPRHPLIELATARGVLSGQAEGQASGGDDLPVRTLLPRFPDDPKARFMQELDDEAGMSFEAGSDSILTSPVKRNTAGRGRWKTIRTLDQFWQAMEFRQECSSGRAVGFLWVVISTNADESEPPSANGESQSQESFTALLSSSDAAMRDHTPAPSSVAPSTTVSPSKKRKRIPLTGPIIPRQPRLKGGSSSMTATNSSLASMVNGSNADGNGLLLTKDGYDKAMHTLLHLDFANLEAAARSTTKYVAEVASICGLARDWGVNVVGTAENEALPKENARIDGGSAGGNVEKKGEVNDLSGMIVKKKRKVESSGNVGGGVATATNGGEGPPVNVLGAGMIRKKPKKGQ